MPINTKVLLYSIAKTYHNILGVSISNNTKKYLKNESENFLNLPLDERIYYTKYSIKLAQSLSEYFKGIKLFEINTDPTSDTVHDFRLTWRKGNVAHISMSHNSINVRDLIPEKLMRICKYKKNTKICKYYMDKYEKISGSAYKKFKTKRKNKYSEVSNKSKNRILLEPICNLVVNTLSKKRKCSLNLYNYLFAESDRIVLKLYKNRFTIYDFGTKLDEVESFRMKLVEEKELLITFNNGVKIGLVLQTNASEIKEHISIKFRTNFKNMDELFAVSTSSV